MWKRLLLTAIMTLLLTVGCQRASQQEDTSGIDLSIFAESLNVGETVLVVAVNDADGSPITNARLLVRGDMTHAGMVPVLRDNITENDNGIYTIPFEWSMGGDWIVTVDATLPDGRTTTQDFNLTIDE